jgi:trans-2,3-dihydro-3-hydroxyanthranilate isomerase
MSYRFVIADVFTEKAFGGNQLAVFADAQGLSDRAMQAFAREINFAETTFVLPPRNPRHSCRLRIFTPRRELPFAGHPTVGTAAVLAHVGKVARGSASLVFEEGIGPVSVEIELGKTPTFARLILEKDAEIPPEKPIRKEAAAALSLPEDAAVETWYASMGVPFCFVHLRDRETVDRASLDRAVWSAKFAKAWSAQLFLFCGDLAPGSRLYARMFAPAFGIEEDPATGSACAALAAMLAGRVAQNAGDFSWRIDQGVAMGRASLIEASAEKRQSRIVKVSVGGSSVIVGEGSMAVPSGY